MIDRFALVLAVACAAAIGLQLLLPAITATSAHMWSVAVRRTLGLRVLLAGAVPGMVAAVIIPHDVNAAGFVASSTLAGALVAYGLLIARYRIVRRIVALMPSLRNPSDRPHAWDRISAILDRSRPLSHQSPRSIIVWLTAVHRVAGNLIDLGDFELAARALAKLDGVQGAPINAATHAAMHALASVHMGHAESAAAAIESVPRPVPAPLTESMIVATEALIHALAGRSLEALRVLDGWKYPPLWHVRTRLEARAHALVTRGDDAEALKTLHELELRFGGATGLRCVSAAKGPASELARRLLDKGDAYRAAPAAWDPGATGSTKH